MVNGSNIRKVSTDFCGYKIRAKRTKPEKVLFPEKHHVRTNHFENHKIGLVIYQEYHQHPKQLRTDFVRMQLLVL